MTNRVHSAGLETGRAMQMRLLTIWVKKTDLVHSVDQWLDGLCIGQLGQDDKPCPSVHSVGHGLGGQLVTADETVGQLGQDDQPCPLCGSGAGRAMRPWRRSTVVDIFVLGHERRLRSPALVWRDGIST